MSTAERVEIIVDNPTNTGLTPEIEIKESFIEQDDHAHVQFSLTEFGARLEDPLDQSYKSISLKSLARIILDDTMLDTGFMPIFGKDYVGIKRYLQLKNKHIVFIEASSRTRTAKWFPSNYDEPVDYELPHPYVLMALTLTDTDSGKLKVIADATRVYCMKTPLINEDTQLYKYPFGNVYSGDRGRVCWGGYGNEVRDKRYNNIMQCGELMSLFLNSGYNNDLFNADIVPGGAQDGLELFEHLKDKDEYPMDTLVTSIKFSELLSLQTNN